MKKVNSKIKTLVYVSASVFCLVHYSQASEGGIMVDEDVEMKDLKKGTLKSTKRIDKTSKMKEKFKKDNLKEKIDPNKFLPKIDEIPEEKLENEFSDIEEDIIEKDQDLNKDEEKKIEEITKSMKNLDISEEGEEGLEEITKSMKNLDISEDKEKLKNLVNENKDFFKFIESLAQEGDMDRTVYDFSSLIGQFKKYGFKDVTLLQLFPKEFIFIQESGLIARLSIPNKRISQLDLSLGKANLLNIIKEYCKNPTDEKLAFNIMALLSTDVQSNIESFRIGISKGVPVIQNSTSGYTTQIMIDDEKIGKSADFYSPEDRKEGEKILMFFGDMKNGELLDKSIRDLYVPWEEAELLIKTNITEKNN